MMADELRTAQAKAESPEETDDNDKTLSGAGKGFLLGGVPGALVGGIIGHQQDKAEQEKAHQRMVQVVADARRGLRLLRVRPGRRPPPRRIRTCRATPTRRARRRAADRPWATAAAAPQLRHVHPCSRRHRDHLRRAPCRPDQRFRGPGHDRARRLGGAPARRVASSAPAATPRWTRRAPRWPARAHCSAGRRWLAARLGTAGATARRSRPAAARGASAVPGGVVGTGSLAGSGAGHVDHRPAARRRGGPLGRGHRSPGVGSGGAVDGGAVAPAAAGRQPARHGRRRPRRGARRARRVATRTSPTSG